ncbi:MAG: PQQ-binding-like beta-propeller repeat protein [Gammaproteobacteria bacterium]
MALALLALSLATGGAAECARVAAAPSSVRVEYDSRTSAVGRMSALIFSASSDGELRALDADSGRVLWTFSAPEALAATAYTDRMTDLAVLRFDANGDGVIDASGGDRVWLYFGLKRAGSYYYALDVSRRTPRILWTAGASALAGLAEAWSTPTVARVRIAGATQNGERFVIVVGGGFSRDSSAAGNHLFMLDAASGRLLWSAGPDSSNDLALAHMTHGIAARIATLDIDGDGFADRLYTADIGGRVWRFDVWNGRARDRLVTGGMSASLGTAEPLPTSPAPSDARRFFTAPDVALMQPRGQNAWYNLAIGSGDGDDTRATNVSNRFYSLRDHDPFVMRSQGDYDATSPVLDADLTPITAGALDVPDDSTGWKLDLASGEAVLAEPVTANGVLMFTTHVAGASVDGSLCASGDVNRVYAIRVETGAAALDLNDDAKITDADRSAVLEQKGIPPAARIETPGPSAGAPTGPSLPATPGTPGTPPAGTPSRAPRCLVGAEILNQCVPLDTVLRTFWKRTSVD